MTSFKLHLNMEKVKNRTLYTTIVSALFMVAFSVKCFSQADPEKGRVIFNTHCVACHKLDAKSIGPALGKVEERRTKEWLHKWIKNSAKLIASGDKDAIAIFEEYNKVAMLPYEGILTDEDIDNVLAYTTNPPAEVPVAQEVTQEEQVAKVEPFQYTRVIVFIAGIITLLALTFVVFKANKTLNALAKVNDKEEYLRNHKYFPLWNIFLKNRIIISSVIGILFFSSTYLVYGYLMQIGIDQGYQPVQEIHYSHKIHAGDNQIDCKFCHSAARTSKTAGIPSLNVCMNCHVSISEYKGAVEPEKGLTKEFYDGEIQKLYDAVGWDKENMKYTGKTKPVKWTRIHNLPDHVYFNHAQHVSVAGIACQECHGPIQEMEVVEQHAPLTMGWCINCHRKTEVDANNPYYKNYEKVHKQLAKKYGVEKLTIAQLGGLECGKCHY